MTAVEALMTVCLVAHQVGVVRDVPRNTVSSYTNYVTFPCSMTDNAALDYYNVEVWRQQQQLCPGCFPWK
jgi:hypothetical protein